MLNKLRDLLPDEDIPNIAWEYGGNGEIVSVEYLRDLTMTVAMEGGNVEQIHSQLHKLIEAEKKIIRSPERLFDLDLSGLENIEIDLDKFSDAEIDRVQNIPDVATASLDINRQLMNTFVNHYGPILNKLLTTSKVTLDSDHSKYPDFWNLINRVDAMRTAVGIMGRDGIRRIPRTY